MSQQESAIKQISPQSLTLIVVGGGNIPHADELNRLPGNDAISAARGDKRTIPQGC